MVFACFVMALLAWGLGFYGHAVFLVELTSASRPEGAHLSTSSVSLMTTVYYLVSAALVVLVSSAVEKLGGKAVALIRSFLITQAPPPCCHEALGY